MMKTLIYCTKAKPRFSVVHDDENGKTYFYINSSWGRSLNGEVVAQFDFDRWDLIENHITTFIINKDPAYTETIAKNSCIGFDELKKYLGTKNGYAYHIDNLQVFDEPVELGELYKEDSLSDEIIGMTKDFRSMYIFGSSLTKAPAQYQYVYYKGEKCLLLPIKSKWAYKILNGEKTVEIRKTLPKEVR